MARYSVLRVHAWKFVMLRDNQPRLVFNYMDGRMYRMSLLLGLATRKNSKKLMVQRLIESVKRVAVQELGLRMDSLVLSPAITPISDAEEREPVTMPGAYHELVSGDIGVDMSDGLEDLPLLIPRKYVPHFVRSGEEFMERTHDVKPSQTPS
jgi:hypothetical protein